MSVLSIKSQLSSLKAEHASSSGTISNLEATVRDKDKHIAMLQDQRQRSGAESEEELTRVKRSHDKLEARVTSLREQLSEKEVEPLFLCGIDVCKQLEISLRGNVMLVVCVVRPF